ncbi:uncharacterized protein M6B38_334215 [Iris pallida]|uniref:Uncharacterized protein n=1 Tax=Iris pallida TaxID=29817 RepID=A0AAX6H1V5_IRIPA|nr:uncharacterized protein M6B38_334215 [Iris pallida]
MMCLAKHSEACDEEVYHRYWKLSILVNSSMLRRKRESLIEGVNILSQHLQCVHLTLIRSSQSRRLNSQQRPLVL